MIVFSWSVLSRIDWRWDLLGISVVYLVEGMLDMAMLAVSYYCKDELGLGPAGAGLFQAAGQVPWELTPLLGLLTDLVPLLGYRRKAYLLLVGLAGAACWGGLAVLSCPAWLAGWLLVGSTACTAWTQVIADAVLVGMSQGRAQDVASFYQAWSWATYTAGAVVSSIFTGRALDAVGPRPVFALAAGALLLDAACSALITEDKVVVVAAHLKHSSSAIYHRDEAGEAPDEVPGAGPGCDRRALLGRADNMRAGGGGEGCGAEAIAAAPPPGGDGQPLVAAGPPGSAPVLLPSSASVAVSAMPYAAMPYDAGAGPGCGRATSPASCASEGIALPWRGAESASGSPRDVNVGRWSPSLGRSLGSGDCDGLMEPLLSPGEGNPDPPGPVLPMSPSSAGPGRTRPSPGGGGSGGGGVVVLVSTVWRTLRDPAILLPALFIFCWLSCPSPSAAMFYFQYNTLHFSAQFQEVVYLAGSFAGVAGVVVYQTLLVGCPLRSMLLGCALLGTTLSATQLLLVTRINLQLGISDKVFVLGDFAVLKAIAEVMMTPLLALAARVCPSGVEATLYACLYSLLNLSAALSGALGALLTDACGVRGDGEPSSLTTLMALCSAAMLLPLPLLCCIPAVGPDATAVGLTTPWKEDAVGTAAGLVKGPLERYGDVDGRETDLAEVLVATPGPDGGGIARLGV